jgi:hypothetical protein
MATIRRLLERSGFDHVTFHHLPPVQCIEGGRTGLATILKNSAFHAARAIYAISGGRLNLDNLFVLARGGPGPVRPESGSGVLRSHS